MNKTIALCGLMGSGKSSAGRLLAQSLDVSFTDLDTVIEKQEGNTIASIFANKGESYFRAAETQALGSILKQKAKGVLALGGGTPCSPGNLEALKQNTLLVYLQAEPAQLASRLQHDDTRPLLLEKKSEDLLARLGKLLQERKSYYEAAHIVVNTVNLNPAQIAERIAVLVREKNQ